MGTSNFYNKNASSIFAIDIKDQWDFEQQFDCLACYLGDKLGYHSFCLDRAPIPDSDNRSFSGRVIGRKSKHSYDPENEIELIVTISAIIRSGYYADCNLDWEMDVEKIHSDPLPSDATAWIENAKEDLILELEDCFKRFSTPLGVTARFSNGNCMYHKKES